jgi:formylglycine-generating enzyme required for sulfatase activity
MVAVTVAVAVAAESAATAVAVGGGADAPVAPAAGGEFVVIGQPGNGADFTELGRVDEPFEIGRYEVTWEEYAAFLNAVATASDPNGLWHAAMQESGGGGLVRSGEPGAWRYSVRPGVERHPVQWVSWYDAARYCNWLHHGAAPGGETEFGAYELRGRNPRGVRRSEEARFYLPSSDEWYKAAYHEPDPGRRGATPYWMYPTRSDHEPRSENPPGGNQSARLGMNATPVVAVGSYPATASGWGVADMAGNVWEWIEDGPGARGGAVSSSPRISAATHPGMDLQGSPQERPELGFRVARRPWAPVLVEEPVSTAVRPGGAVDWVVRVVGEAPWDVEWWLGDRRVATGERYRAELPVESPQLGPFRVVVTNRHGVAESRPFSLSRSDVSAGLLLHLPGELGWRLDPGPGVRPVGTGARVVSDPARAGRAALEFDGAGGVRVSLPNQPHGTAPRTLAAWVWLPEGLPVQPTFVHLGMGNWDGRMFGLGLSDQQLWFWGGSRDVRSGLKVPATGWHFVAVVYDPPALTLAVDDQVERRVAPELATVFTGGLWLGAETIDDGVSVRGHFRGRLGEVWVYGRALSADELQGLRVGR